MQEMLNQAGFLLYSLPVAVIVLLSRESFRNFLFPRVTGAEVHPAGYYLDIISILSLAVTGKGWGGILHRSRRDTGLTYLLSQVWLVFLIGMGLLYFYLKNPDPGSYVYFFTITFLKQCWVLFLLNFIPIPPFDAAYFYFQPVSEGGLSVVVSGIMKFLTMIIFLTLPWKNTFLSGDFLVK